MSSLAARSKALFVMVLMAASLAFVAHDSALAQQTAGDRGQASPPPPHRGPLIGGTSLTLGYIWGPAKMPPPANDFGPGFDYPGTYSLDGAPNHSPYPN